MNGQEITSIILTFFFGFIFGMYLYFSGFLSTQAPEAVQTQADVNAFSLIGEVYGGCRDTCPSFQIVADGSYRYQFTPTSGAEQIIRDGTLPVSLMRDINGTISVGELERQGQEITPSLCNSFTDGIDVEYRFTIDGEVYRLDSCTTAVGVDSPLWGTLVKIWNYFETGTI